MAEAAAAAKPEEAEYFSNDFDWESLKQKVETNPSFQFHLRPHLPSSFHKEEAAETRDSNAWQSFHIRHSSGKFFKRRYLLKEFPELVVTSSESTELLEVGCGNGSSVIPILRGNKNISVYACDCSNETLVRVKEMILDASLAYAVDRFIPFFCDFSSTGFPYGWLAIPARALPIKLKRIALQDRFEGRCCVGGVDFITLIFTLSAVPLKLMPKAIKECFSVLNPGGLLLFRDYGRARLLLREVRESKKGEDHAEGVGSWQVSEANGTEKVVSSTFAKSWESVKEQQQSFAFPPGLRFCKAIKTETLESVASHQHITRWPCTCVI